MYGYFWYQIKVFVLLQCQIGKNMNTQCPLIYLCLYFAGKNIKIENIEMQSSFEEKVNIEDLVLSSDPTGILNAETIDLKEDPLEQGGKNTVSILESRSGILNMDTREIKEESFVQNSNNMSIHGNSKSRMLPTMPISVETILKAENDIQKHFKQQQKPDTFNLLNNCKTTFDDVPSDKSFFEKIKEIQ